MVENHFIEWINNLWFPIEVEAQAVDRFLRFAFLQCLERRVVHARERELDRGFMPLATRVYGIERFQRCADNFDWPNGGVITGAETTRRALNRSRIKPGASRNMKAGSQGCFLGSEPHDGHRRNWREVMRIKYVKKRLGYFRKFVVNLEADTSGQKGESFDEAFDVRVFAFVAFKQESRGDLGVLAGKLRAHLPQED